MSEFDALTALSSAGVEISSAPEGQRAVLASLSEPEVALLAGLKARLDAATPDVAAHVEMPPGGMIF